MQHSIRINVALFLVLMTLVSAPAFCGVKRLQICASQCETAFCKKLAEEVEFEFELSGDFLLPSCTKGRRALPRKEFRLVFSEDKESGQVLVELDCQGSKKCLSESYKGATLTAKVISDVKASIKHNKPFDRVAEEKSSSQKGTTQNPATPFSKGGKDPENIDTETQMQTTPHADPEWDRVVLVKPSENKVQIPVIPVDTVMAQPVIVPQRRVFGSATMSFGGENWNYAFESASGSDSGHPFHSRIYPRVLFSAAYWPLTFLRISTNLGASVVSFRLKANQPVEGDGQLIIGQMYQSDLLVSAMKPLGEIFHLGIDSGYEFLGAFIDKQRIEGRALTIVPGFQAHGIRVGPRFIVGAFSDKGMIDIGVGFYPYVYYVETPDEPTTSKSAFAWSAQGVVRLMLGTDIFADATVKATSIHVRYDQDPMREGVEGEKWGPGKVRNTSASATVGLGWLF